MSPPIRVISVDDVFARVAPYDWAFAKQNAEKIAALWRARVAEKPALFDGRVLLLSDFSLFEERGKTIMRSAHFETSYSAFTAWLDSGGDGSPVRNCFSMAALRGNDGGFLLAEMGAHTSNAGQVYFPSGTPDLDDVSGETLDLEGSVLRELEEETGLAPHEAARDPGWIVVDAGQRLACMKIIRVDAPAQEIARDLNARIAAQKNPELAGMRVARGEADLDPAVMPDFMLEYLRRAFSPDSHAAAWRR